MSGILELQEQHFRECSWMSGILKLQEPYFRECSWMSGILKLQEQYFRGCSWMESYIEASGGRINVGRIANELIGFFPVPITG